MTFARIRLALAAALFLGWLGWLGYAVTRAGGVQLVSRAQVTGASWLVIGSIAEGPDGRPGTALVVKRIIPMPGLQPGKLVGTIVVLNLPAAATPVPIAGGTRTPPAGEYLVPLIPAPNGEYRVAGLPRSPGYDASTPERPLVYPWTADVQAQLRALGLE